MKLMLGCLVMATVVVSPARPADHPGKAVYDSTCKRCHGEDGTGDRMADRFYQVTIPRLNSDYVQSKTDAEIKEIVTKGKGKMQPVQPGAPSMRHTFSGEDIDEVIAYVRTFKKEAPAR